MTPRRDEYTSVCPVCGQQAFFTEPTKCRMAYVARCKCCGQSDESKPYVPCKGTHRLIDRRSLSPLFAPFYGTGQRIRVRFAGGQERTGTVSRTGGWVPSYMLMLRADSMGSSWLLGADDRVIAIQGENGKYRPTWQEGSNA